jgi:hypothetical protein
MPTREKLHPSNENGLAQLLLELAVCNCSSFEDFKKTKIERDHKFPAFSHFHCLWEKIIAKIEKTAAGSSP